MDTNIENSIKYANSFRRTTAVSIDIFIVGILRVFIAQFLGIIWLNEVIQKFLIDFKSHFGTDFVKNNPDHIDFVIHHKVFSSIVIFYILLILIGTFYHSYLNSSSWRATIGKRAMGIIITKQDYSQINFMRGVLHYFLSVLPIAYVLYIIMFQAANELTLFNAITASGFNLILGFAFALWVQTHIFTKKKTTAYDMICKVIFIESKMKAQYPWSKNV